MIHNQGMDVKLNKNMRNLNSGIKSMFIALICGAIFASCGGGSMPKSDLKKSDVFGNLPALHDENAMAKEIEKERLEKMTNLNKIQKELMRQEKAQEKRDAVIDAELERVKENEVSYTFTDAQKASGEYDVVDVNVVSLGIFTVDFVPLKVETDLFGSSSFLVNFRFLAKDGSVIQERRDVQFYGKKGEELKGMAIGLRVAWEEMIDLASIEFFASEE
jgi:hypothetical protein